MGTKVAVFMTAWIEMESECQGGDNEKVAVFMTAWIEISVPKEPRQAHIALQSS